jgi:hypothetical protein
MSLLILFAAGVFGGPISAAISAIAVLPSLLTSYVLTYLVLIRYSPPARIAALGLGFGLYAISVVVVLICLSLFGPTQIM